MGVCLFSLNYEQFLYASLSRFDFAGRIFLLSRNNVLEFVNGRIGVAKRGVPHTLATVLAHYTFPELKDYIC